MNVGDILRFYTKRDPNKAALRYLDQTTTYEDLNLRTNRLANGFLSLGFKADDKVALLMRNCPEYIETILALAKIGVVPVPINFRLVGEEIAFIVNDSDSKGLILERDFLETITPVEKQLQVTPDRFYTLRGKRGDRGSVYEDLFQGASEEEPTVEVDENTCFVMCYTSGTTGRPKGVPGSHRSKILESLAQALEFGLSEEDIHLVAAPLCHSAGLFLAIERLFIGGTLCIMREFDPEEVLRQIEKEKATNTMLVPTMLNFILELPESKKSKYNLSSMRVINSAGSPLPTRTKDGIIAFFKNAGLYEYYASTESSVATVLKPVDQMRKVRCAGKPFYGVSIKLVDENRDPVASGEVGEIFVKSPMSMDGYYKRDDNGFEDGWFASGDLARQDEEGYFYIVDRMKDMIISGGENIYPTEIEDVLYSNPAVLEAAVIGVPDDRWGESVMAVVVLQEGQSASQDEIIEYCRQKLAGFKIPRSVRFVSELPKNTSGKILRRVIREQYWNAKEIKV